MTKADFIERKNEFLAQSCSTIPNPKSNQFILKIYISISISSSNRLRLCFIFEKLLPKSINNSLIKPVIKSDTNRNKNS